MCSIHGVIPKLIDDVLRLDIDVLRTLGSERGRDGVGYVVVRGDKSMVAKRQIERDPQVERGEQYFDSRLGCLIGNNRAEPTTEYVAHKRLEDQQPYCLGDWAVVHNGTIANDKELRTYELDTRIDSAAIVEQLALLSRGCNLFEDFKHVIEKIKGSYAILAVNKQEPDLIFYACNYRPIWYSKTRVGIFIASSANMLPIGPPQMIPPYSVGTFGLSRVSVNSLLPDVPKRSLVVCSGGLDSVVAATVVKNRGDDVRLIHFQYGSRAEGPEVKAVQNVAKRLDVPLTLFPLPIYDPKDSPLLRADSTIAGGESGAEFAHEWVPARNLVMLSVATAFAEANGYNNIVLGNNLEEAGAYPDNEPEFINRFNEVLPFAVGDGKRIRVEMPVGNLMKHEIVKLGHEEKAPMELTWSCYRAGEHHCGSCGPCFMRRKSFEINNLPEVIGYDL